MVAHPQDGPATGTRRPSALRWTVTGLAAAAAVLLVLPAADPDWWAVATLTAVIASGYGSASPRHRLAGALAGAAMGAPAAAGYTGYGWAAFSAFCGLAAAARASRPALVIVAGAVAYVALYGAGPAAATTGSVCALIAVLLYDLYHPRRTHRRPSASGRASRRVSRSLLVLPQDAFAVLADVPVPSTGRDVGHVVVGVTGAWALTVLPADGRLRTDRHGTLHAGRRNLDRLVAGAAADASRVGTSAGTDVLAVLVATAALPADGPGEVASSDGSRAWLTDERRLRELLESGGPHRTLTTTDIDAAVDRLTSPVPV